MLVHKTRLEYYHKRNASHEIAGRMDWRRIVHLCTGLIYDRTDTVL
jgi:hypothetical protein